MSKDIPDYEFEYENTVSSTNDKHSGGLKSAMARRFRGYLPVVIDVESGGFNSATDALLEIAAVIPAMDDEGLLYAEHTFIFPR